MNSRRVLRAAAISAALTAGMVTFAPSAFAQYEGQSYWNGAPRTVGPATNMPNGPMWYGSNGPLWYGPSAGVTSPSQPYWQGAPNASGPNE